MSYLPRELLEKWRKQDYPGVTGIIKRLPQHWQDLGESTVWTGGLNWIHRARRIIRCFDLSATPFAPSGKKATEEALFLCKINTIFKSGVLRGIPCIKW